MSFTSIDLFSGGGGLSEGLRQAGFKVLSAVENNPIAADTFRENFKEAIVIEKDIRHVTAEEIMQSCQLKKGQLDLLTGCPPCQGFSTLTSRYKRDDERNSLITEVSRLVKDLLPKAIMIENVPGLMNKGKGYLNNFLSTLEELGYQVNYDVLQVADYGVPQQRRRFVLLAGLGFEIKIPTPTHSSESESGLPKWMTVKEAIFEMEPPITLAKSTLYGGPRAFNWNVTRSLSDINKQRLQHVKPGGPRFDIPDHLRPKCHQGNNKGFSNVYGRMDWAAPSPTITGGCTVLSKGRFGHPSELRTISVREAARLQTFPDSFTFASDYIDHVCQIIGNALPCKFAKIMSEACKVELYRRSSNTLV
jgi:DNA (cytosine-5)-methyltransferase 1